LAVDILVYLFSIGRIFRFCVVSLFALLALAGTFAVSALGAAAPVPAWAPVAVAAPTNLPPGGEGTIVVYVQNVGGAPSSGTITIEDQLPSGLTLSGDVSGEGWECPLLGPAEVVCTTTEAVPPGAIAEPVGIPVEVGAAAVGDAVNSVTVTGGAAAGAASYRQPVSLSAIAARPGVQAFTAGFHEADGSLSAGAGSHPHAMTAVVFVNTVEIGTGEIVPAGDAKAIELSLPPGFLANPAALPGCAEALEDLECPSATQVGIAEPIIRSFEKAAAVTPVHSIAEPNGYPAMFTMTPFNSAEMAAVVRLRSDDDYGTSLELPNISPQEPLYGAFLALWGESPAKTAFLTLPTGCELQAAQPPSIRLSFEAWQTAGAFEYRQVPVPPVTGCESLDFGAELALAPTVAEADSPSAFEARLTVPTGGLTDPPAPAASELRQAVVALPAGVTLNASVADGLQTCSAAQIGLRGADFPPPAGIRFDNAPNRCPEASKIGTAELQSALLGKSMTGTLYLAEQGDGNPFGSLLAFYLVVEDRATRIVLKLPGAVDVDPSDGRIAVTFRDLPQIPITSMKLAFKGGSRSLLATPSVCGQFVSTATGTPWSAPESGPAAVSRSSFAIGSGPEGGACAQTAAERPFAPGFRAGTTPALAGHPAPVTLRLTRADGEQELDRVAVALPPGIAADLREVATCSPAALAARACSGQSQVGTATIGAGVGPTPYYLRDGRIYLAGPYKGAPLSLALVLPMRAGPLDLGVEVVRMALRIDPDSGGVTVDGDPLPQIVKGIPTKIRDLRIELDRPGFTRNPSSCEPTSIAGIADGASGAVARLSTRFQVGGCERLGFKPRLSVSLSGAPPRRGGHPQMKAVLRSRPGGAGIRRAAIVLPQTELLENAHVRGVCPRPRFAAGTCPRRSVYGEATVWSPLLDEPLRGPVYLRASAQRLPDLAAALDGRLRLNLAAKVDSVRGRVRTTFEGLPDFPVSRLALTLRGGRRGLLVNNTDLCRANPRAAAFFRAHNDKARRTGAAVGVGGCGKDGSGRR